MTHTQRLIAMAALSSWPLLLGAHGMSAQGQAETQALFQQLQRRQTSGEAAAQLLKEGRNDAKARQYLASHLPALIEADPRDPRPQWHDVMRLEWYNAVQLAANLKLGEAAPALAMWISYRTDQGVTGLSHDYSLQPNPAALALVQIGDPAIPSLQGLLAHGKNIEPWLAARALDLIGSPAAKSVLEDYVSHGQDRKLADFIRDELETERRNKAN